MKVSLSNKLYDVFKFLTLYILPGLASLYFGLAGIWRLPYPDQVVGTILVIATFLGVILGFGVIQYNKLIAKLERLNYTQPTLSSFIRPEVKSYFPVLPNKLFDVLYWFAQIVLPALGTIYFALASIWGLPYSQQIVGTIALIDTFLGIFLGINTVKYDKYKASNN